MFQAEKQDSPTWFGSMSEIKLLPLRSFCSAILPSSRFKEVCIKMIDMEKSEVEEAARTNANDQRRVQLRGRSFLYELHFRSPAFKILP